MGEGTDTVKLILIISAILLGVVALGFFIWTIYIYQKNKKYIKKAEDNFSYSASLFYTALGGKDNVIKFELKGDYINFELNNPNKIIVEYIKKLPSFVKIVGNGRDFDIYFTDAIKIYEILFNDTK